MVQLALRAGTSQVSWPGWMGELIGSSHESVSTCFQISIYTQIWLYMCLFIYRLCSLKSSWTVKHQPKENWMELWQEQCKFAIYPVMFKSLLKAIFNVGLPFSTRIHFGACTSSNCKCNCLSFLQTKNATMQLEMKALPEENQLMSQSLFYTLTAFKHWHSHDR